MGKRLALMIGVAAVGVAALGAQTAPAKEQQIGLLYVQTATWGTMKPIKGTPRFNLTLHGVNPQVVQRFSDRPKSRPGQIPIRGFTHSWAGFGFVKDPPNAALLLPHADDSEDTLVVELGRPSFKKKRKTIRYSARLLNEATGNLSHLNSDLDPSVNWRFRAPSLIIDDAVGKVINGCVIEDHTSCPGANLAWANLPLAHLSFAKLSGANLSHAYMPGADLFYADLSGAANLSGTMLVTANLAGADLRGAELREAILVDASLVGADLTGADLTGAKFCGTTMPDGSTNNRDCH